MSEKYLLDTHAMIFWYSKQEISPEFTDFFDERAERHQLYVSVISFWEIALLAKKGKVRLENPQEWQVRVVNETNIQVISPTAAEVTGSVFLPDHHKDPFDRILIVQAMNLDAFLVTKDTEIPKYQVKVFWL